MKIRRWPVLLAVGFGGALLSLALRKRWRELLFAACMIAVPLLAAIGAGDALANGLFGWASSMGQVSLTAVLGSLYPVATIILARVILGERLRRIQQVGVVAALAGAALIAAY